MSGGKLGTDRRDLPDSMEPAGLRKTRGPDRFAKIDAANRMGGIGFERANALRLKLRGSGTRPRHSEQHLVRGFGLPAS